MTWLIVFYKPKPTLRGYILSKITPQQFGKNGTAGQKKKVLVAPLSITIRWDQSVDGSISLWPELIPTTLKLDLREF
jgi:hypothetical protein